MSEQSRPLLPGPVTFSIQGDPWKTTHPVTGEILAQGTFDDAYAATITVRHPSSYDRMLRISPRVSAMLEERGPVDPGNATIAAWKFAEALAFFEVLAVGEVPPWLRGETDGPEVVAAIFHAHAKAQEKLTEAKKNFDASGGSSLPGT